LNPTDSGPSHAKEDIAANVQINPRILVVSADPGLFPEVELALEPLSDVRPVIHAASDYRKGLEMARNRQPDLALVEMTARTDQLTSFVEELAACAPRTTAVAVFHPLVFGPHVSESQVLIRAIRSGVRDFMRRPVSTTDFDQIIDRMFRRPLPDRPETGKIVCFFTNKGGVGKTTLAVNTATMLATRYPNRVLLIDASIQMGLCSTMLDLRPESTMSDVVRERSRLDETLLRELSIRHSSGLHLLPAPNNAIEAASVDDEVMSRVLHLARRSFDFVVIDTFPMIDRVLVSILDLVDTAYLITESTVPILDGTSRMLPVLDDLGLGPERRRLVLNRYSTYVGNLPPEDVRRRMGFDIDFIVPYERKLLVAANTGSPMILQATRFSKFYRAVERIADDIASPRPVRLAQRAPQARESALANGNSFDSSSKDA